MVCNAVQALLQPVVLCVAQQGSHLTVLVCTGLQRTALHCAFLKSHCNLRLLLWYPGAAPLVPWGCFSGTVGLLLWYAGSHYDAQQRRLIFVFFKVLVWHSCHG